MSTAKQHLFTGRKMLLVVVSFFGVIMSVNFYMAYSALSTFPGLEVENSYVASQQFNKRAAAQRALGWTVAFTREGKELVLNLQDRNGNEVTPKSISAIIGRPTFAGDDIKLDFQLVGHEYRAQADLASGPWRLFLDAVAQDGTLYKKRLNLVVNQ